MATGAFLTKKTLMLVDVRVAGLAVKHGARANAPICDLLQNGMIHSGGTDTYSLVLNVATTTFPHADMK